MENQRVVWKGIIEIIARNLEGKITSQDIFYNSIHNVGLNMLRDLLKGDISDGEIKYVALGNNDTAINKADTTLQNEIFRKQMTSQTAGATGVLLSECYIAPAEAVGTIKEIGWFAGAGATGSADSGVMLSRVLYSKTKTNLESIYIRRTDTISEA